VRRTTRLRHLLLSPRLEFLLGAHNGLSAKIVEETGFQGIWASGLEISASLGVRDNNEASWTQVLEVVEFMSDAASSTPILLDADTGYGNFNNARRLVRKLEQREVAGMCIEDKLFPKTNSFINSEGQTLASIEEFVGKIKAVKDTQSDPDFCLVARVEAFLAGLGLAEALDRAHAYREAGADAVLIHSKRPTAIEVLSFMEQWEVDCPVVIVPTLYPHTAPEVFERAGISTVIWANHLLRSCISAMQRTAEEIHLSRRLTGVEERVVPLKEVFRLQDHAELEEAERRYLAGEAPTRVTLRRPRRRRNGAVASATFPSLDGDDA
jgi:phosphoenolpyruvate phosphomutase